MLPDAKHSCARKFADATQTALSSQPSVAQQILDRYGITADLPDEEAFRAILNYINGAFSLLPPCHWRMDGAGCICVLFQ